MPEKLKCQRCESTEPAKEYNPHTPGHPDKAVNLCDKCADKDPRATLKTPVEVPMIEPVVPEVVKPATTSEVVETIEFAPPESNAPSITTPKDAPPVPPSPPMPAEGKPIDQEPISTSTEGTIPRSELVGDMQRRQADVAKLLESHQALLAQQRITADKISNCLKLIAIQQGAVAQLKSSLGIKDR